MKQLKKEFQTVTKEVNALTKKTKKLTEKLTRKAFGQLEKAQAAVTPETAARRAADALKALNKTTERMIKAVETFEKDQKKKGAKATPKRKPPARKKAAPRKKTAPVTATDQVLKIVKRSKKGVDVPSLAKRTGFEVKKVRSIVSRGVKQGKIKRVGRGLYAGV